MGPQIGIVADDLTGGTTVGALLARRGVPTTVLFSRESVTRDAQSAEGAVVVSTDSRAMPPEVAFGRVRAATLALAAAGARQFAKRIDTTCRGGIGAEVEGMLAALDPGHVAVIVPAMPQSRRIVVDGYSVIDSVLLARTGVAQDVRTPVTESHLPTLLADQFSVPIGHVGIGAVLAGAQVLQGELARARTDGARAILVDAASLEDVTAIAQATVALDWRVVAVDPGPFTTALAAAQGIAAPADRADHPLRDDPSVEDRGTVVVVAGSATGVTHRQIARVRAAAGTETIAVDPADLLDEAGAGRVAQEVVARARAWHRDGHPRVAVLAFDTVVDGRPPDPERLSRLSGLSGHQVAIRLSEQLGRLARVLADEVGRHCAGFYLTGGDVMVRSVAALGAQGITLRDFVIPQVDHGVLRGGPYDGLPVVCKGGLTGDDRTALHSVNRLFDERSRTDAHSPA